MGSGESVSRHLDLLQQMLPPPLWPVLPRALLREASISTGFPAAKSRVALGPVHLPTAGLQNRGKVRDVRGPDRDGPG